MIQIKNVTKLYPAKAAGNERANGKGDQNGAIHALDDISLHVAQGEWLSIMGPSGSGKSTLVNLIGCLDRPTSGEIWLDGQNVAGISSADLN
ncbi:MAG: ATP-binding cassette domain-containing protein, partial [Candidatus Sulfotelmatobacter sp.]